MSVPSRRASSTFKALSRSTIEATKRSWMPWVTMKRLEAGQRWPVEKYAPWVAQLTPPPRAAASRVTRGVFAPLRELPLPHAPHALLGDGPAGIDRAGEAQAGHVG